MEGVSPLHLNSIKISGFKSFAEEVELILEPGITTIVGPNGCGKSNVSDAMRWVLGQQNARALRCTNMQGLLFNGGADFSPAQKAKVSLAFSKSTENLTSDASHIEVTRQLTRTGESSYFMNQAPCRLRDIREHFMDTGIGVDAYSVMEQSKIEMILNVRPEERRFLFDEVAGITKYKHRKKTALRKLEETEQNLVRVNDVIQELQRETESLKAQAKQAKYYQRLQQELQQFELNLAYREYERFATAYRTTQSDLDKVIQELEKGNQQLNGAEERIEHATRRRAALDDAITAVGETLRSISAEIEKIERQIVLHKERQLNIQEQRQRALKTIEALKEQQTNLLTQKRQRRQEYSRLEAAIKVEDSRLTSRQHLLTELATRLSAARQSVRETETGLAELTTQLTHRENRRLSLEHSLQNSESNLKRSMENSNALRIELKAATDTHTEAQHVQTQLKAELLKIEAEKNEAETSLRENQEKLRKAESEMRGLQQTLGMNVSRLKSLQELQSAYEGYYIGVRAILQAKKHYPEQFDGICGVMAELLSTDTVYETAIEVALGSAIQHVVTETAEDAQAGIAFLKKHRAGRVTFLPLDILRGRTFSDDALLDEPGVIGIAEELVNYNTKYRIAIQHLLGNTLIIEDLDTAIALTRRFHTTARLVTLDGEVINISGAITGGHANQKKSGLLTRSRELEVLESKIGKLTQTVTQKDDKRKKYAAELARLQQNRQKLTTQWQDKRVDNASLTKDIEQANLLVKRVERQLAEIQVESHNLERGVEVSHQEKQTLADEIAELEKKQTQKQRRIQRMNEQIDSENRKREDVGRGCQEMEIFLAGQRQKLEGLKSELKTIDETQKQTAQNIEAQQLIIDDDEQTKSELGGQIEEAQRQFLRAEGNRAEAEVELDDITEERQAFIEEITEYQKQMRVIRRQFDKLNRKRHQLEVNATQLEMQIKSISRRTLDKYQVSIDIANITEQAPTLQESDAEINDGELMDRIEKLKAELGAMGAVNLKAIETHAEHKERYDFLVAQRADIEKSIQATYQAIRKINQTSRAVFLKTFEQVKINFQEVFSQLFGGGETELVLTDESDVLESGIEIIARPPGKRPQSITQLSGGERSLVAIGLLFAVFRIKPSPFCVLDEVDAALDEANVMRFMKLIRGCAEKTQFVIITHNRRTMEIADVMYGVTMEQAGMSKIVSAKFAR